MRFIKSLPWWIRIAAKIVLARLPINYRFWKNLGLFEHGDMNLPARALETFVMHAQTADILPVESDAHFSVLELGPGDSIFTALIARAHGASRSWLVDSGSFATKDPTAYNNMAAFLQDQNLSLPFKSNFVDFHDVLTESDSVYLTEGVDSLSKILDQTIDFCFSNAVMEHIPINDFPNLVSELWRILKPNGVCVHRVDLKDHLGGGLNNLRFSDATWEGALFSRSGFYTNRIRYAEMLASFQHVGFNCQVTRKITWPALPIPRSALAEKFKGLTDEDLLVSGFDVVLRRQRSI